MSTQQPTVPQVVLTINRPDRPTPEAKTRRGYTGGGDFIELGAVCRCGRAVEAADVDLDADRLSVVCSRCHEIVLCIDLPE